MRNLIPWIVAFQLVGFCCGYESLLPDDYLHDKLFKKYNPDVIPLPNNKYEYLIIGIALNIQSLVKLDIQQESIVADFTFHLRWNNHQLKWNVSDYEGLSSMILPKERVWTPTLITYPELTILKTAGKLSISYNGTSNFIFSQRITKKCASRIDNFPNDFHNCSFEFIHFGFIPRLHFYFFNNPYLSDFKSDGAWKVINITRSIVEDGGMSSVVMEVLLKRHPKYLIQKLVIPILILSVLPILTFLIPLESGERISFGVTALLTVIVAFQYIMEQLPQNDSDPWIVSVSKRVLGAMLTSVVLSAVNLHLYYHTGRSLLRNWLCVGFSSVGKWRAILKKKDKVSAGEATSQYIKSIKDIDLKALNSRMGHWREKIRFLDHLCLLATVIFWIHLFATYFDRMSIHVM